MRWNSGALLLARLTLASGLLASPAALLVFSQPQAPPPTAMPSTPAPPVAPSYLVMIDPAHGGSDSGAALNPAIPEKDVTLAFARRLRQELNSRGISATLVRDADIALSLDQRAGMVNAMQPGLYLTLHAASQGNGVVLYTAMLPPTGTNRGRFLDWQAAQSGALVRSRWAQQQITASIHKMGFPMRSLTAELRPLNNVTVAAMAVEVAPTTGEVSQLASVDYQSMVCAALANSIVQIAPALRQRTAP
ncbi:MAG TPA: N-acetylmuramoyl-L-alanine amidase [Terriglobales bacterium]